jgi:hypothetical protein
MMTAQTRHDARNVTAIHHAPQARHQVAQQRDHSIIEPKAVKSHL